MLSDAERKFLAQQRVAHLATADARARPHVIPVCFAIEDVTLYITIDEKPKARSPTALKRLRNIAENPAVALVAQPQEVVVLRQDKEVRVVNRDALVRSGTHAHGLDLNVAVKKVCGKARPVRLNDSERRRASGLRRASANRPRLR